VQKAEVKTGIRGEDKTEIVSGADEGAVVASKLILPFAQTSGSKPQQTGQQPQAGPGR